MVQPNMLSFRTYILGGGGAALVTLGTVLVYIWSSLVRNIVYQQLQVKEGTHTYRMWKETPVPQYMNFYLFNWTNSKEFEIEKPRFSQLGPYRFSIKEKKTNIVWNSNGTITFKIQREWYFDEEKSNGKLSDELVTLNSVALSAAKTVRYMDFFMKKAVSSGLWSTKQKISVKKSIGEVLFFGYSDPLLDIGRSLPAFSGIDMPPFDKFAWFYKRNGSNEFEGTFNMDTGRNEVYSFGRLRNWNYANKTSFYPSTCAYINGSAGELFPPGRTKTNIEMFSPDLCRSLSLSYAKEEEFYGVPGYKYHGDEYTFDNGTLDPNNKCFCGGECSPSGVLNVTKCRFGAPGFVSFPHFYLADDYYLDQVEGLEPKPEKHSFSITLEPTTGIPLDVAARFQINLLLSSVEDIGLFETVPTIYFPMLWFEHRASITEALAAELKLVLQLPFIGQCFSVFLILVGIIMILFAFYLQLQVLQKNRITEDIRMAEGVIDPLLNSESKAMMKKKSF